MWAQSRGQKHTHWFVPVALMLIAAVAATLRFWDLGHRSLWIDEAYSWFQANGTFAEVFTRTASDNYPPLHNMVLWAVSGVFGDSETALRAPSAVFATLNVVAVFLLGCRLAGRGTLRRPNIHVQIVSVPWRDHAESDHHYIPCPRLRIGNRDSFRRIQRRAAEVGVQDKAGSAEEQVQVVGGEPAPILPPTQFERSLSGPTGYINRYQNHIPW